MEIQAAIDRHMADQLLLPLCLASGRSSFTTSAISQHRLANAAVIQVFLPVSIPIEGFIDQPGHITIMP